MLDETREQTEKRAWKEYVARTGIKSIDFPYYFTVLAINVIGVMYINDPFENSSTKGIVAGAVNGTYDLKKDKQEATLYDPTHNLLRVVLVFNVPGKEFKVRADTRRWDGSWNEGDWGIVWRG